MAELIYCILQPTSKIKAKLKIRKITEDDEYLRIVFKNNRLPLYFPKTIPLRSLYQVIAEAFYPHDWHYYEIEETKVSADDIVLDCGAAEGIFSFNAAHRCKKIYVIEPLPKYVRALQKTFLNFANVEIMPIALSDKKGISYIAGNGIGAKLTGDSSDIKCETDTIDNLFYGKGIPVSYIKADLEGYELPMLEGAKRTIKKYHPKIAITTYHKLDHKDAIYRFIKGVDSSYRIKTKGIEAKEGATVMLHAW